jgi:hypothetical protein
MLLSLFSTFAVGLTCYLAVLTIVVPFLRGFGNSRRDHL